MYYIFKNLLRQKQKRMGRNPHMLLTVDTSRRIRPIRVVNQEPSSRLAPLRNARSCHAPRDIYAAMTEIYAAGRRTEQWHLPLIASAITHLKIGRITSGFMVAQATEDFNISVIPNFYSIIATYIIMNIQPNATLLMHQRTIFEAFLESQKSNIK